MKIAVFMGGSSAERDVSLNSGKEVARALREKGHEVLAYDVTWTDTKTLFTAVDLCCVEGVDVVFLALHGGLGENGGIQGVLEAAGLAYTGSGIMGSALAMDKDISKKLFVQNGIPTARWIASPPQTFDPARVAEEIGFPCVVKPADQGSTIGLTVVREAAGLLPAAETAGRYTDKIMAEAFIPGAELTVPVLDGKPLPAIEIRPSHDIYDYECKYTSGMSQYLIPAPVPEACLTLIAQYAIEVYNILCLRDFARIDFRLDAGGMPLCFEANTLPGMTGTSLVPKSAKAAGIEFPELVSMIAETAYRRTHP